MDRRALKFMQKRADTESDTTTPVSATASQGIPASAILAGGTLPLKDNSNIREKPLHHNYNHNNNNSSQHTHSHQPQQQQQVGGKQLERPLKCLETLAQKAGITFDEKYDVASPPHPGIAQQQATSGTGTGPGTGSGSVTPTSHRHGTPPTGRRQTHTPNTPSRPSAPSTPNTNCTSIARHTSLTLEKAQNPGQQVAATTTVPLQISPEQLQQFYASNPYAIQVKQEFPTHTTGNSGTELKHATNIMEVQQQLQLQQQLSEASGGGAASAGAGGAASPANSQQSQQQQHSTAISTMSPMQLAAATGGVGGDWTQGRTVQLMQPSTSFLYPQMIVSGNLLHPGGLGQQPIQVITAGKPFQGNGPQMLTTTTQNAKQMIGGQAGFAGGNYATCIPTNHNQSPQTVLFSPMNVISPQQQQNLLQSMAAAAQQQHLTQQQQQFNQQQQQQLTQQQQQLTAALAKVGVDAQGKLAQKVVQKVTTTSSAVQAATGAGSTGSTQTQQVQQVQQQQQQTTQTTQQCVQVSQSTLPVGVGAQSVQTAQLLNAGQAQQMQIPWFLQNAAGLQPFGSNQIILRNQPDGTQGMFIQQQPATQTLQTQQNQIIQCNVTQTPTKARTQLDALAPKQQQQQVGTTNQTQQQQLAVATAQLQQQQQQLTAAALQRPGAPIMPHNGTQVRPASSVSTQTAQNQSLLKAKMRNKQQPVRPALSTLKTEIGQVAGQNKVVGHLTTVQQQQQATNLQQVVNAAGNKMVVMSTTGTPITLQNGQTLHAATTAGVDKQQQIQLIEKQQLQLLQQMQQQIAAMQQMQRQQVQQPQQPQVTQQQQVNAQQQQAVAQQQQAVAQAQQQQREQQQQGVQAQAQHQQALANATQQILQVAPNQFITSHQQQQQQQLHNQLIQQQLQQQAQAQVQAQVQAQAQQQQQQREQQQNIIQQIVVQQSAGAAAQQQQQQQHHQSGQLQLSSVPFSVSSTTTPAGIATSSALQAALSASGAIFQTAKPGACSSSSPTSSVVTITNQNSTPLVTSSTVASLQQAQAQSQAAQVQQHQQLISATIAGGTQQQQQGPPSLTPTTNPILAMTSMMNATVGHLSTAPPVTVSVTSTAVTPSPGQLVLLSTGSSGGGGSIPATPTKDTPSKGPTATLVPISSPKTPVSGKDCTTPKSSTPATVSASVEASSSTSEALSNGEASDRSSTPSKGATTPTSKQSNAVQPPSSTTPSASGKEEPKLATSGSLTSATSTSTTTTITNGIGVAKTTATTTTGSTTTTTSSGTFTTSCTSTTTTTTSSISNGSKDLPKAMIKPNVLTHVIDGFIIQEANEPFPVTRQRYADKDVSDEPPKKKATMQEDIKLSGMASAPGSDMVACEQCGKMEHKAKLKRKRYCSPGCSRQAKNGIGGCGTAETNGLGTGGIVGVDAMALVDKLDEAMAEEKMQTETSPKLSESFSILGATTELPPKSLPVQAAISASSPLALPLGSPLSVALPTLAPLSVVTSGAAPESSEVNGTERPPISSWSVDDVSNFIRELPGCQDYVDDFIQQEIDGQALLLLKENHLVNAMGMKLGPALKIVAKVESIKEVPPPGEAKDPGAQ
ncbi:polyhomeotic-proximal chromatin protein [Drosophila teissieri]|uniref:polyhomeotic-proximal chromatin protein n=1 Tax=Drosophila teissieri TaxID=7243 RepID=UPI001CBA48C5|nr:polyhomeotic-proximal chromatin protein [Drosophila teissieri]XP_043659520.1 polyhomeotic-proximal chromatin protein [Drosophila teissieri]